MKPEVTSLAVRVQLLGEPHGGHADEIFSSAHFPKFVLYRSTHLHELRKVRGTSKLIDSRAALSI
jgi:hypothetical protein